jgi:hypothetical protein
MKRLAPKPAPAPESAPPARGPERFVGRNVSFDMPGHPGVRATGRVIAAKDNGVRAKGAIPDYLLTVRGKSGREAIISMFDTYATLID